MKRDALALAACVGFGALGASMPVEASQLIVCNDSRRHSIRIAYVHRRFGLLEVLNAYPWTGGGWSHIRPGACADQFTGLTQNDFIWMRVESEGRLVSGFHSISSNAAVHISTSRFCVEPERPFEWRRKTEQEERSACTVNAGPAVFPLQVTVRQATELTLRLNPDEAVASLKPDAVEIPFDSWLFRSGKEKGAPTDNSWVLNRQIRVPVGKNGEVGYVNNAEPSRRAAVKEHFSALAQANVQVLKCVYSTPDRSGGMALVYL